MRAHLAEAAVAGLRSSGSVLLLGGEAGSGKSTLARVLKQQFADLVVCEDVSFTEPVPRSERLLMTYRPEEIRAGQMAVCISQIREPSLITELIVPPLTLAEVAAWVGADRADELHELTGGNARAIAEVLRSGKDPIPPVIRFTALARLSGLTADALRAVHVAAAAGRPLGESLLRAASGASEEDLIEAIEAYALFETSSGYAVRHPLAAKAIYAELPGPLRRMLHLRLAEAAGTDHELAGVQYRLAGRIEQWRQHFEAGAESAAAEGDVGQAVRLLRDILVENGLSRSELIRIGPKFGAALEHVPEHAKVEAVLRGLIADPQIPATVRGELRLSLGLVLSNQVGDGDGGFSELVQAIPDLAHNPNLQVRAMAGLSVPGTSGHPVSENLYWLRRAAETLPSVTDPVMRLAASVNIGSTLLAIGDRGAWRQTRHVFGTPASPGERLQKLRGALNFSDAAVWLGHYRQTRRFVARGRELTETADSYAVHGISAIELILDFFTGAWDGLAERAEQFVSSHDIPRLAAEASFVAGALQLARGKTEPAVRRLNMLVDRRIDGISPPVMATGAGLLIRRRLASGDLTAATRLADSVVGSLCTKQIWAWVAELVPVAAEAYVRAGRQADAEALVADFAKGCQMADAPAAHAAIPWCEGVLAEAAGNPAEAAAHYERAARRYAQLPRPYDDLRARAAAARCVSDTQGLLDALSGFEAMGATADATWCKGLLRALGVQPPRGVGRRGYGERLSPREAEVVRLAAEGRTNAEIGQLLFVSPRTAEQHLARALRKLGIRTRRELSRSIAEMQGWPGLFKDQH